MTAEAGVGEGGPRPDVLVGEEGDGGRADGNGAVAASSVEDEHE